MTCNDTLGYYLLVKSPNATTEPIAIAVTVPARRAERTHSGAVGQSAQAGLGLIILIKDLVVAEILDH